MKKMANNLVFLAYKNTIEKGGITINLSGLQPVTGYMVGRYGFEQIVEIQYFNPQVVADYIRTHIALLRDEKNYLGIWLDRDSDKVYFDISQRFENKRQAMNQAIVNRQICIFDLQNEKEIYCLCSEKRYL